MLLYQSRTREVIGLADNRVKECKLEGDPRFIYHESRLPSIEARFKSDVLLCSLNKVVTATRGAFLDELTDTSHRGVVISVPTVTGDNEGDSNVGIMPKRSSSGR